MGIDCYCNFHSEPGSIPVPQNENSINSNKKLKKNYSQQNEADLYNKISTQNNINEQILNKNENSNKINNTENDNSKIKKISTFDFEKKINEIAQELSEEKFFLLIQGKIKEIEAELGEINQIKKKEYINQNNQNVIFKPPLHFPKDKYTYFGTWSKHSAQKEGWGIIIDEKGNKYEGGFKSDKFDGYGRIISINGSYYEGEINMGKVDGEGVFFSYETGMLYKGAFKNNVFEGKGQQIYQNFDNQKIIYEGQFSNGKREGKGKFNFGDGNYYEGDFKNDKFEGQGYFKFKDGREYNGNWKENEMNGKGVFTWDKNKKYDGEYKDSRREGFGIYYFGNNNYYEGYWLNNLPHGEGKLCNEGKIIVGLFRFGKFLKTKNLNGQKLSSNQLLIEKGNGYVRKKSKKLVNK